MRNSGLPDFLFFYIFALFILQLAFWRKYLTVYQFVESGGRVPGTYIQHSRRVHSQSVCGPSHMEIVKVLRSPPSAPSFNENECKDTFHCENGDCVASNETADYCKEDPALRCLSDLEEVRELEEVTLTPEQEDALTLEATYGALFSHIWWAVWALIQAQISSFEFGFIEYAESRMTAYYNLKKTLPASEFPNQENQSPDIPCLRKANEQLFIMDSSSRVCKSGDNKKPTSSFYVEEGEVD
nr:choline:ethanolamine kinase [Hymenolepis microstoma]